MTTIEGLADADGGLSSLQEAFRDAHGFQCAFCAPGLPDDGEGAARATTRVRRADEIREALSGNLCRCTGYESIIDSVEAAARSLVRPTGANAA